MADQQYEYVTETVPIYPSTIKSERISELLNERAVEGWVVDQAFAVDTSTVLVVFRREV